jgi:hypothetical protein
MSEIETSPGVVKTRPPLQIFFIKLGSVLAACLIFFVFAVMYIEGEIRAVTHDLRQEYGAALNGGSAFWTAVENRLYSIADEKDLPAEKKARILAALRRVSQRYGPYLEALSQPAKKRSGT